MRKRVYISGPISGLEKEVYEENFLKAEQRLFKLGFDVVNPCKIVPNCDNPTWGNYMLADLNEIMYCNCIYMLFGSDLSIGAMIEKMFFNREHPSGIVFLEAMSDNEILDYSKKINFI